MPVSDSRRRARDKWDKANTTTLACKVRKERATRLRELAALENTTISAIFLSALRDLEDRHADEKETE